MKGIILAIVAAIAVATSSAASDPDPQTDACNELPSCSSCLGKTYCTWCVTKSKCTKQSCGNDNVIYPRRIKALLSGPQFCPRIVRPEKEIRISSGKEQTFKIKLTQLHLYMAFTVWKCKIKLNSEEQVVKAALVADEVYCDPVVLYNLSDKPVVEGRATVLWEYNKKVDGSVLFIVCRCDLDPNCADCKK